MGSSSDQTNKVTAAIARELALGRFDKQPADMLLSPPC
jgi:hypothetical protein